MQIVRAGWLTASPASHGRETVFPAVSRHHISRTRAAWSDAHRAALGLNGLF